MDKTTVIGIILGIIAVGVGMVLKGVNPVALLNPAALLIIFVGTAASVLIATPANEIKKLPKLFAILFKEQQLVDIKSLINEITKLANLARREGLLSIEQEIENIDDLFFKNGLKYAIDGLDKEVIEEILLEELDAMEDRHAAGAAIFTQAGTYAPTLGVLGAVIGLIAALGNMNDTEALGHAIAAAFVATLFGIFSGYVLWHPFAQKLKRKSKNELKIKQIMIEGILSIQDGQSPAVIEDKLASYLPMSERLAMKEESEA